MPPVYGQPGGPYGGQSWGSYYLPGFNYGSQIPNAENSDLADYLQKQNFQIAYDYWSQGAGLAPNGAFAQYVRSQEPLTNRAFNTATLSNPDLTPQSFLKNYMGGMQQQFQSLPYQLRGENPRQWGQGRTQWVKRNN